jgi:hypothetical protein
MRRRAAAHASPKRSEHAPPHLSARGGWRRCGGGWDVVRSAFRTMVCAACRSLRRCRRRRQERCARDAVCTILVNRPSACACFPGTLLPSFGIVLASNATEAQPGSSVGGTRIRRPFPREVAENGDHARSAVSCHGARTTRGALQPSPPFRLGPAQPSACAALEGAPREGARHAGPTV